MIYLPVTLIPQSMMKDPSALLDCIIRIPNNMYHGHELGERTANTAERTELSRPERRHKGAGPFDSCVAVGGVGGDKLIGRTGPGYAFLRD